MLSAAGTVLRQRLTRCQLSSHLTPWQISVSASLFGCSYQKEAEPLCLSYPRLPDWLLLADTKACLPRQWHQHPATNKHTIAIPRHPRLSIIQLIKGCEPVGICTFSIAHIFSCSAAVDKQDYRLSQVRDKGTRCSACCEDIWTYQPLLLQLQGGFLVQHSSHLHRECLRRIAGSLRWIAACISGCLQAASGTFPVTCLPQEFCHADVELHKPAPHMPHWLWS